MRASQALLAGAALVSSASAFCIDYNARMYPAENDNAPGVYYSLVLMFDGDDKCSLTLSDQEYHDLLPEDASNGAVYLIEMDCKDGWEADTEIPAGEFVVQSPDEPSPAVGRVDWDGTDGGVGLPVLLSDDGNVCS